jgi:hypothetical protein
MHPTITESGALYLAQHRKTIDEIQICVTKRPRWILKPTQKVTSLVRSRELSLYRDNGR